MKESFNGPEFLGQKFQDIHTSEEAQTLAEYATKKEKLPHKQTKHATIDRYLRGLDRVMKNRPSVAKMIEESITDDYVLDTSNEELVQSLARDLYESEKKIAIQQGRGGDIQQLNDEEILERYRENILEKAKIQKESLHSWIRYLKEGEDYPMWFKYYVVRSLKKMGQFNRDTTSYSTRTENTIAPFPEMNAEALAFVYQALVGKLEKEELSLNAERKEELEKELEKRLASKDFAKLYAFAQVECAGSLDRESLEGEWVIYPQGSDYKELERGLKGKGTGWCTAAGSAQEQLANGDFHVFYTKNKAGISTEPRIAIRMEEIDGTQTIAEVRGVDHGQALEPALIDTAKEHYSKLDGAERYEKADRDMKMLTAIYDRCFKINRETQEKVYLDSELSKAELQFIYELDGNIQGFGYERDPRIKELRKKRNTADDLLIVCECAKDQVACSVGEINEDTKVYNGGLEAGIFKRFPPSIKYIYTSFPEKRIKKIDIELVGKTPEDLVSEVDTFDPDIVVNTIRKTSHDLLESREDFGMKTFCLSVGDLGFDDAVNTDKLFERARELGLDLCPPSIIPDLARYINIDHFEMYLNVGMMPIVFAGNNLTPCIFVFDRGRGHLGLGMSVGFHTWNPDEQFVFCLREDA